MKLLGYGGNCHSCPSPVRPKFELDTQESTMQSSAAPQREILRAEQAVAAMRAASSIAEFDEQWKQFLHRLERVWSKTVAHFGRSPKWGNWAAKYEKDRRQDMLLSYLCNARGAEEHTTAEVTGRDLGGIGIGLADGVGLQPDGSVLIESLVINSSPEGLHIQSTQPLKITFRPERVRMEPVVNRGRTYVVPTSHLGQTIDSTDLSKVAEVALQYYKSAVSKAEEYFVK